MAFAASLLGAVIPGSASAEPSANAFPGMEIHQGTTVCTLGMVVPMMRFAVATGQCDGGSVVTDSHGNVLGAVIGARHSAAAPALEGPTPDVQYEVIKLDDTVKATDVLSTGRQLQSVPGVVAQPGESVCHFGISTGESCGSVASVNNGRFVITGWDADASDVGGPVYTLTADNRAVIVGLFEGASGSATTAESWQAVMQQLYIDGRTPGQEPPLSTVRIAGAIRKGQ
ncbi:hypothetical protein [Mycobacterium sp.]|uniref:Rv1815 family serine proteinase n=1 Tax=Mycobacterium sp. TaxID=1785 RepID=UPI002BEDC8D1|nr:hypothetical protein [Mycobacterium sp.]HTQ16517.1 hypothetical protein [Mycobacterium sp.]